MGASIAGFRKKVASLFSLLGTADRRRHRVAVAHLGCTILERSFKVADAEIMSILALTDKKMLAD